MRTDCLSAISFDIGGTLVAMARGALAEELAAITGTSADQMRQLLIEHGKRRATSPAALADRLAEHTGAPAAAGALRAALEQRRADTTAPALYPETLEVLARLRHAGWRICYLSNAVGFDHDAAPAPYMALADHALHSWESGHCKPEPAAFGALQAATGLGPEAFVHVGNSWRCDVEGALEAGWQAVYLPRGGPHHHRPGVPVIDDLTGLLDLLPERPATVRSTNA